MKKLLLTACSILIIFSSASAQKLFNKVEKLDTKFVSSYLAGEIKQVDLFAEKDGSTTDSSIKYSFSIIEWSAVMNCQSCLEEFISNRKKLDPFMNIKGELDKSVAHAVRNDNMDMLDFILENGGDINHGCVSCHGQSPIQVALTYNNYPMFFKLLQLGANPNVENFKKMNLIHTLLGAYEDTKTHSVISQGITATTSSELAKIILDTLLLRKVDIKAKNKHGENAIVLAAATNNPGLYDYVKSKGLTLNTSNLKEVLTALNYSMYYMAEEGLPPATDNNMFDKVLKELNMVLTKNHSGVDDLNGTYILISAVRAENKKAFDMIMALGPNVDIINMEGESPLDWAVINGNAAMAEKLLDAQAKVSKINLTEAKKTFKGNKELIKKFEIAPKTEN